MTEEASEFYSRGAERFAENYSQQSIDPDYLDQVMCFAERVKASIDGSSKGKVLDAGCGPGRDSQILSDEGFDVKGVDLSEEMIGIAGDKDGDFRVMDVRDLEFEDETFDCVLANQLLVFFEGEEREKAFRELERVLKSGRVIFLGLKKGEEVFVREKYNSEVKQYPMTEEEARELLEDFNIHDVEITEREGDQPAFMNFTATKK